MAISLITPWLEKVQEGYEDDEEARSLLTELSLQPVNDKWSSL